MQKAKHCSWFDLIKSALFFLKGVRISYLFWTVTILLIYFYQLVPTFFMGLILDFFTKYKSGDPLDRFYVYLLILSLSSILVSFIRITAKQKLGELVNQAVYEGRIEGFERLIEQSLKLDHSENTGNKVEKIQNGLSSLSQLLFLLTNNIFSNLIGIVGIFIFFLFRNTTFLILLFIYLILYFLIQSTLGKKVRDATRKMFTAKEKASGSYFEELSNAMTIESLGAVHNFEYRINSNEEKVRDLSDLKINLNMYKWKLINILSAIFILASLILIGSTFTSGIITLGSILIFYSYIFNFSNYSTNLGELIDQIMEFKVAIGRMMEIFYEKVETYIGEISFPRDWKKIEIKNGEYEFKVPNKPGSKFSIKNLNFVINKGERVGIVGRSGSGKSTLTRLLLGIYKLDKGEFLIDNMNFYDIKHKELTKNISIVLQDSELFNLTLKDNITLMKRYNEYLLKKAVSISQLQNVIDKLPKGIHTQVGEKGNSISGGEKQRIGIARGIYKDSPIIIFDEATSSLDSQTEKNFQEAIDLDQKDKTIVLIAHRLATLKNTDRIYVFENGEIVETGRFKDLINNSNSKFYELYKIQELEMKENKIS